MLDRFKAAGRAISSHKETLQEVACLGGVVAAGVGAFAGWIYTIGKLGETSDLAAMGCALGPFAGIMAGFMQQMTRPLGTPEQEDALEETSAGVLVKYALVTTGLLTALGFLGSSYVLAEPTHQSMSAIREAQPTPCRPQQLQGPDGRFVLANCK